MGVGRMRRQAHRNTLTIGWRATISPLCASLRPWYGGSMSLHPSQMLRRDVSAWEGGRAEFGGFPSDLIDASRDEVGDHLDGDADPQTVLQVVKLHRRPGLSLFGTLDSATSARLLS